LPALKLLPELALFASLSLQFFAYAFHNFDLWVKISREDMVLIAVLLRHFYGIGVKGLNLLRM